MKRILSTMLVVAMMFALCVAAFAAADTGKASCADADNILDFYMEENKANKPTFTTDGEVSFKNPAEGNTGVDCFIRRDGSLKGAYGSKFAFAFELKLNKIDGDTSTNPIVMIQIKDSTGAWGANHKFFTIAGDGAGAYVLADGGNSSATKVALAADTWYQFVIHFDLDADTATVVGGKYASDGKGYTTLYTAKLNAKGDIPTVLFGQGDSKDGWKYDYLVDSLRFFSTSTSFADGVNGEGYHAGIFGTKDKNNAGTADCYYKVVTDGVPSNRYVHYLHDGTIKADGNAWIVYPEGDVFSIEADYQIVKQNADDNMGWEIKYQKTSDSTNTWFTGKLPATEEGKWNHIKIDTDLTAGTITVYVNGEQKGQATGVKSVKAAGGQFRIGSCNERDAANFEYKLDNIVITAGEDVKTCDFENVEYGITKVEGIFETKDVFNKKTEEGAFTYGIWVDEDVAVPATESYLAAKDADKTVDEAGNKTDAIFYILEKERMRPVFGDSWKVTFKYLATDVGDSDKLGIEAKADSKGWITPKLPAAAEWTDAEFIADGVNGTWTLNVAGAKVAEGKIDATAFDDRGFKLGCCNERDNNAFDFAIDEIVVTPILCEAAADETSTAEETTTAATTTAAATTAPDAPVNPGTGSVAGFIALVSVIAIGTGIVVSKKH